MNRIPMPKLPAGVRRLFRLPFRTYRQIGRDLDDEVRFHLDRRVEELIASGVLPEAARSEALRRFGDAQDLKAFCHALERPGVMRSRVREWFTDLAQDLRFAGRQLLRSPGFALLAVATMALGIGATTTIYCAVHDLLLRPLPYRGGDRLVVVDELAFHGRAMMPPTQQIVDAWRARTRTLEGILTYQPAQWTLTGAGDPQLVGGEAIDPALVPFLGVAPVLGRRFTPDDARQGAPRVALIGEQLWRRRFARSRDVLGKQVALDGQPYAVVGVMPRDFGLALFSGREGPQVFVPLSPLKGQERIAALGRLRVGSTPKLAARELSSIPVSDPATSARDTVAANVDMVQESFQSWYRSSLLILLGAVGLVLLIACANVANLLLMRTWSRQREIGIRTAIGAGRGRIVRQILTESVVIGLGGGALGAVVAWRAVPLVAALAPGTNTLSALARIRLDPTVLGFTLGLALLTGILFGLAPALLATEGQVGDSLKGAARSAPAHPAALRTRGALVVAEVAILIVLLTTAGLLVRSLVGRVQSDQGIYAPGLLSVDLELPADRFPSQAGRAAVLARIAERVRGLPGVEAVSSALKSPWIGGIMMDEGLAVQGVMERTGSAPVFLDFNIVSPDYFRTAEIPILAGRVFNPDTMAREAVVGRAFARKFLATGGWIGARFRDGDKAPWWTVVGVVADPRYPGEAGAPPQPMVYKPFAGTATRSAIVARAGNPGALLPFVTRAIMQFDPAIHVTRAQTVRMALADSRAESRFLMTLLATFAGLALVLAAIGLYGVVAYSVKQRTREIGVRVALGAGARDVLRLVLRQSLGLSLLGVAIGVAGALAAARLVRNQLYGVGPGDPATYVSVAALLALVALAASYLPARAALRIDPVEALRADG